MHLDKFDVGNIVHCAACFIPFNHDDCQACKDKVTNQTPERKAATISKDPSLQNNPSLQKGPAQNSAAQSNPPPQNHSSPQNQPAPKEHPNPNPTSATGQNTSPNTPSSTPSSFHSSSTSLSVGGTPGASKLSIPMGGKSYTITSTTSSATHAESSSAQTSPSANATAVKANEHLAAILGVVCGVLSFLLLCLAFWFFFRLRRRRRQRRDAANNWQWLRRYDKWKDVYSPSVKGGDLPDYGRVESGERRRSEKGSHGRSSKLTEGNLEMLERHSSRTSSIRSHNTFGSGKSSNSQHTLPTRRRDLRRVFSMGALTHTTGTTSKSALVIALPPESHPKQTHGSSPSSKVLQALRTYDPVRGPTSSSQIRSTL
ncbi:hypothetical protein EYR40_005734 [Pleurotus pulmonarius]|nr:hypothetical protein EYR40_005734 [Pleurotus pulmonarius]